MTPELLRRLATEYVEEILQPELLKLETDTSQSIDAKLEVLYGNECSERLEILSTAHFSSATAHMVVRVRFRETIRPNCYRFWSQAIVDGLAPGSGFSGFGVDGELSDSKAPQVKGIAYNYNVRNWDPTLQIDGVSGTSE